MTKKMVNGVLMDMTPEEENQRVIDIENDAKAREQFEADKKAYEDLKASAKAKLIAGEPLTEAEANTIVL